MNNFIFTARWNLMAENWKECNNLVKSSSQKIVNKKKKY